MKSRRISFLLPFGGITGGIRAVVEMGNRLEEAGHPVTYVMPRASVCSRRNRILRLLPGGRRFLRRNRNDLSWARPRGATLEVADLEARHVPPADLMVATAWQTAERLMSFPPSHGIPVYLIQHYETWSGPPRLVDRTWRAGFHTVVTAPWLEELARERFGITDADLVPYGVDPELFSPDPEGEKRKRPGTFRVGLLSHPAPWKATAEGLEALRILRERGISVQPVLFGDQPPPGTAHDPGWEPEVHVDPPQDSLRKIYSSMDAYLCPSHTETGPLTVLEAMACRVPVVSTRVGSVSLWTEEGRTALLAEPGFPAKLAGLLERLAREPALARRLAEEGLTRAHRFTWAASARALEDALRHALKKAGEVP